jgi:hypothetical protein
VSLIDPQNQFLGTNQSKVQKDSGIKFGCDLDITWKNCFNIQKQIRFDEQKVIDMIIITVVLMPAGVYVLLPSFTIQ